MKQVLIIWNDKKTTNIAGKYAFRIALNFLVKMGVFDTFGFMEIGDTYFFYQDKVNIEWVILPNERGRE